MTTQVLYAFRGRRTYYPGLQKFLSPLKQNLTTDSGETKGQQQTTMMIQPQSPVETEVQALKRMMAALMSSSVACADGA